MPVMIPPRPMGHLQSQFIMFVIYDKKKKKKVKSLDFHF